jgi:hypothetical protein
MRLTFRTRIGRTLLAIVLGGLVGIGVAGLPRSEDVPPTPEVAEPTTTTTTAEAAP